MRFHIENMTCGGCVRRVTKAVQSLDHAAEVEADPATRKVTITTDRASDEIEAVLAEAGYPAVQQPA